MKQLITLIIASALFSINAWAQCTPPAATGSPFVSPPTDSLPCIEQGVLYNQTVKFEMPQTQPPLITGGTMTFDSILNIPCGIDWYPNRQPATYNFGETGCFAIVGTSTDNVGQYLLEIYITVTAQTLLGPQTWSGRAEDVIADIEAITGPTGIDLEYYLRVKAAGGTCPDIDTTNANNLTAQAVCPPFNLAIIGDTAACDGDSVTLTVDAGLAINPLEYLWSTGATTASIKVAAPATVSLRVVDGNLDTVNATHVVSAIVTPAADINTPVITAGNVSVTSTHTADSFAYSWDFGGVGTGTGYTASYTFTENGTYDITLIVSNSCGSDTTVETVTISGIVGINNLGSTLSKIQVVPNPSNGNFNLNLVAMENSPVSVKVFNLQGQVVYTTIYNVVAGQASTQAIQLNNAASGIYIIQVQANDALVTEKLMVK